MIENTVLVTGAPRSGTTPLGQLVSMLPGAVDLYEPMGPTGDQAIQNRFPMPGEPNFTEEDLAAFLKRMQRLDMSFKSQRRPGHRGFSGFLAGTFGTRSLLSYYRAKFSFNKNLLVWKDPHAVFCAPLAARAGFKAVVTMRPPHAHAASFKRLGWVSLLDQIYPRYCAAFGAIPDFDKWIAKIGGTPFGSAALLWHMTHKQLAELSDEARSSVYFHNMEKVAEDEMAAYIKLFDWLGKPMPASIKAEIVRRTDSASSKTPGANKVHNFNRTAAQANSYWQKILSPGEVDMVTELNGPLWKAICDTE